MMHFFREKSLCKNPDAYPRPEPRGLRQLSWWAYSPKMGAAIARLALSLLQTLEVRAATVDQEH